MSSILILVSAIFFSPWVIILIFTGTYLLELALIRLQAQLQHEINTNERATITSINSLLVEVIAILFSLTIGYFSTQIGMVFILYLMGGILLISSLFNRYSRNIRIE